MRRFLPHLLIYAACFFIALIITYPAITTFSTRLIGHPFGDAYEYTAHIWWITHALRTGQPIFHQPLLLYPDGLPAALLWSLPLQSFPAWLFAFIMPLAAAFNLSLLLTLTLNGWSMWLLSRHLLHDLSPFPSLIALLPAVIFMAYPTFQGQTAAAHIGLLQLWGAPLLVYAVMRLRDATHPRRWIIFAAFAFCAPMLGSLTLALYLVAPVTLFLFAHLIARREWRAFRLTLIALILGILIESVFALPYLLEGSVGSANDLGGTVRYSASALAIVSPSFQHPIYGALDYPGHVIGREPFEGAAYIGILTLILTLIAVIRFRPARTWLILALIAWMLSLGPLLKVFDTPIFAAIDGYATSISLPYALIQNLPFIDTTRTPARFNFTVAFALAVMAGYGAAWIIRRRKFARLLIPLMCVFTLFDYQLFWGMPTINVVLPEALRILAARDDIRAVLNVPFMHPLTDKDAMFLQTAHQQPIIAGHIARATPLNPARGWLLESALDPALLDSTGVDVIILHREWDDVQGITESRLRSQFGDPTYIDDQYALFVLPPYTGDPPALLTYANGDTFYAYIPQTGSATITGEIASLDDAPLDAALLLDGVRVLEWTILQPHALRLPVTLTAGYHTVTLTTDPLCVTPLSPSLECRALDAHTLTLTDYQPEPAD